MSRVYRRVVTYMGKLIQLFPTTTQQEQEEYKEVIIETTSFEETKQLLMELFGIEE